MNEFAADIAAALTKILPQALPLSTLLLLLAVGFLVLLVAALVGTVHLLGLNRRLHAAEGKRAAAEQSGSGGSAGR